MSIVHYNGSLGEFDYNDKLFKVEQGVTDRITYVGESSIVSIPNGLTDFNGLFRNRVFNETFKIEHVNCSVSDSDGPEMFEMFSRCTFNKGLDLGNEFSVNSDVDVLFDECIFKGFLKLGNNFVLSYRFFKGCKFYEGCNLGDIKISDNIREALCDAYLGDDFYLPDIAGIEKIFECDWNVKDVCPVRFPSYVMSKAKSKKLYDKLENLDGMYTEDFEEAVKYIKRELASACKKMRKGKLLISDCTKSVVASLKDGKTIKEIKDIFGYKYDTEMIDSVYYNICSKLESSCMKDISNTFVVEGKSSKYTVGEMQEMLVKRGYPREVVNACLVGYLSSEYLCN